MPKLPALEIGLSYSDGTPAFDADRLRDLLTSAAEAEKRHGEIGIWLCTDDEIAGLHQRFMDIAGPTDVISFPGDSQYLGDIAVSFETAAAQAIDAGHPVAREIAYLALHGLLHLLDYDDLTPREREQMLARQDELIAAYERVTPGGWD
jgi:probable rRNA maturation factor